MKEPIFDPWPESTSLRAFPVRSPPEEASPPESPPQLECWRCGKLVPAEETRCLYCRAHLASETAPAGSVAKTVQADTQNLIRLLGIYGAILTVSVLAGVFQLISVIVSPEHVEQWSWSTLAFFSVWDVIHAALVLVAWFWAGSKVQEPQPSSGRRFWSWVLAMPALAGLLILNFGYHQLLRQQLGMEYEPMSIDDQWLLTGWILLICIQPAIFEELFFRYLIFGALEKVMSRHAVVWVTAVMFAVAHIYAPLSIPVLFLMGIFFGCARCASGGIYLPMFLHFLHNLSVIAASHSGW